MTYKAFLKSLGKMVETIESYTVNDQQRVENLKNVWTIGRDVYKYKQETGTTARQIAEDIGIAGGTMDKFVRIYRQFPEGLRAQIDGYPLNWSHYAALIYVHSKEGREFYLRETALKEWSSHDLRKRVRNNYFENRLDDGVPAGRRVERPVLKPLGRRMYTYAARVLRVIDGDTLHLSVDVGFKTKMEHKVRLRGINCAEVNTELGDKARAFVKERLLGPDGADGHVVMYSYKAGKFGRYIADVWYLPHEADPEVILKEGRLLNQELLDQDLAVIME